MLARMAKLLRMRPPVVADEGLLFASGATVPTDAAAGYQTGCVFQHTDGSAGTAFYVNEGSNSSCSFAAIAGLTVAQEALLGATAGTVSASKAVIVDASKNIAGFGTIGCGAVTADGLLTVGSTTGGIVMAAAEAIGISILTSTPTDGINIAAACANAIAIGGNNTGHALDISGTWGLGLTGGAVVIGDYSNAIAFGSVADDIVGQCIHISGSTASGGSNIIPFHSKFTTTANCFAGTTAQAIYGRVDIKHDINGSYGVRGAITIADTPEINQAYGMFATVATTLCNLAATGYIAGLAVEMAGTSDVTKSSGYGKVCGIRVAWGETSIASVETCGAMIAIAAGSALDTGYRVNAAGTLTSAFHSENATSTPTNGLALVGAHTNAFAFPAEGTAPVVDNAQAMSGLSSDGYIVITIGGVAHKLYYFA